MAGTAYDVSFWLENYDDTGNNRFGASFGGVTLVPEASQGPFGYRLYTFNNVMPGANADLHFIFYNPAFFFYLDDVCVTVSGPSPTPTCPPIINEGFDNINNLPGWVMLNHSQPLGTTNWFQGDNSQFRAFDGFPTAYIAADFDNGGGVATISNWLLTPAISLQNGNTLTFYTRTLTGSTFPDRLQVRMSTNGSSINVGTTATQVGDFINMLLDINPTYVSTDTRSVDPIHGNHQRGSRADYRSVGVPLFRGERRAHRN